MNRLLQKIFFQEPKLQRAGFRYGFLAFWFGLTIVAAVAAAHLSPSARGRYFGFIVPPTLFLNHLAFQFRWPQSIMVSLRAVAVVSCGVMVSYTLFVAFSK
jgi:hypothetical protein